MMVYFLIWKIVKGLREAFVWKMSWRVRELDKDWYHIIRTAEDIFVRFLFYPQFYLKYGILGIVGLEVIGWVLYQRFYCLFLYKDFFYRKTSKWLGISYPPVWIELILSIVGLIYLIFRHFNF